MCMNSCVTGWWVEAILGDLELILDIQAKIILYSIYVTAVNHI